MIQPSRSPLSPISALLMPAALLMIVLATSTACQNNAGSNPQSVTPAVTPSANTSATPASPPSAPSAKTGDAKTVANKPNQAKPAGPTKQAATPKPDPYPLAIDRASSAYQMGRSAQSKDDWRLVAKRWQQAIDLLKTVPASSPNRAQAQQKITQYQRNLQVAQQQASRSTAVANPDGVVVVPRDWLPPAPLVPAPIAAAPSTPVAKDPNRRVFHAPIVRREGNTPVIRVMFNNRQPFDMIVDTGASGTLITRQMANLLGVIPVAETMVDTASQQGVSFPLGYVQSIEVDGAVASNVLVAIAGSELDVGLLGHDFFGNYDVTIRKNEVEFRVRS